MLHTQAALTGSTMVYAASKVMEGEITGAGPSDPTLQQMWRDAGYEPYSIRGSDGKWHSYRRTEPFATFLGMVADTYEVIGEIPEEDKDELEEKLMGAMSAVFTAGTRNVVSKSWTESLLDFFAAIDEKDGGWEKYLKGTARGMVPQKLVMKFWRLNTRERRTHEGSSGHPALCHRRRLAVCAEPAGEGGA